MKVYYNNFIKTIVVCLASLLCLVGCSDEYDPNNVPEIFQTKYNEMKDQQFDFSFGDVVKVNDSEIRGIICDISKDEMGIGYGIIFISPDQKLFARSIPSGLSVNCISLFDITYLNEKAKDAISFVEKVKVNFSRVGIGSRGAATNLADLITAFERGLEKRKQLETPCDKKMSLLDPVNENYQDISYILE